MRSASSCSHMEWTVATEASMSFSSKPQSPPSTTEVRSSIHSFVTNPVKGEFHNIHYSNFIILEKREEKGDGEQFACVSHRSPSRPHRWSRHIPPPSCPVAGAVMSHIALHSGWQVPAVGVREEERWSKQKVIALSGWLLWDLWIIKDIHWIII